MDILDWRDMIPAGIKAYTPVDGEIGGVLTDMKVATLLIVWSLSLPHAGGHAQSPRCGSTVLPHAEAQVDPCVMQQAGDRLFPDDPSGGRLGASLWDEEDCLEDSTVDGGILLPRSWRDLVWGIHSAPARSRHNLSRIASRPHPLRC